LIINPNGGSYKGSTESQTIKMQNNTTQTIEEPTREGYTFGGWTVSSNKAQINTNEITIGSEDCTITAIWIANTYSWIAYHYKMNVNGSGYTLVETTTGEEVHTGDVVTPEVKTYEGFTSPSAQTITIGTTNEVRYNYTRNQYKLTINPNGGEYKSSSSNTETNEYYEKEIEIEEPIRTGYSFTNWTKSGGGTLTENIVKIGTSATTLTANWTANEYTVTFNSNGGNAPSFSTTDVTYDSEYGTLPTISRTGYDFKGWYTSASGGTKITSTSKVQTAKAHNLYAQWTAKTYTVTLNKQSGTGGPSSVTATYDQAMPTLSATPQRAGYAFGGYYTSANCLGTQYYNANGASARTWDEASDTTLYACWSALKTIYATVLSNGNGTNTLAYRDYNNLDDTRLSSTGINFTATSSSTNGNGLYYGQRGEDLDNNSARDVVYYYRGLVNNNYLIFAGYCWRIVRTNEDGASVRIRYGGKPTNGVCPQTGTSVSINSELSTLFPSSTSIGKFHNLYQYDSYNGYLVGSQNAESSIALLLKNWYGNKIFNLNYDKYVSYDAIYCNDRSNPIEPQTGNYTLYKFFGASNRLINYNTSSITYKNPSTPQFGCPNDEDRYTATSSKSPLGKKLLTYPIGLLTADEVVFAGGRYNTSGLDTAGNPKYYLVTGQQYWTMSAFAFSKQTDNDRDPSLTGVNKYTGAQVFTVSADGALFFRPVDYQVAVLPVISLDNDAYVESGNGNYNTPFVIQHIN